MSMQGGYGWYNPLLCAMVYCRMFGKFIGDGTVCYGSR